MQEVPPLPLGGRGKEGGGGELDLALPSLNRKRMKALLVGVATCKSRRKSHLQLHGHVITREFVLTIMGFDF
jgi:hypothetical protein